MYFGFGLDSMGLVNEFHAIYKQPIQESPVLDDVATNELRVALLKEEVNELEEALALRDPIATLDALTDIQYVLDGAYLSLGFAKYKEKALLEVQRSNLTKLGADGEPIYRESDGKVQKGPFFSEPDLKSILEE